MCTFGFHLGSGVFMLIDWMFYIFIGRLLTKYVFFIGTNSLKITGFSSDVIVAI